MVEQSIYYSSLAQQNTPTVQATNDGNYNFCTGAVKSFLAVFMALYAHGGEGTMPSRRESVLFRVNLWYNKTGHVFVFSIHSSSVQFVVSLLLKPLTSSNIKDLALTVYR